ncbi:MAG TPA: hypothetical protein VL490_01970 [Mucilaginibacter sp.]|nr:hypothetical protein [Mucilaginibacter sp.]
MRTVKLISRFYGNIFLANFLVTLSCVYLLAQAGKNDQALVAVFFWYKIISMALIFYTAIHYKKNELYYYQNLGISKLRLILTTSAFDLFVWLIFVASQLVIDIPGYIFNLILWGVLLIHLYVYIKK